MHAELASIQKTLDKILARDEALRTTNAELSAENKKLKNDMTQLRRQRTFHAKRKKCPAQ